MADKTKLKKLFIGTSGWSYKHWIKVFYPENIKPAEYLEYYITKFNCVELNASFYYLPKKITVNGWQERTPDDFRFCPKLSRFITHIKRLKNIEEALARFFDIFYEMKKRSGPVLIQLPPGLQFEKSRASDFLCLIKEQYSQYRFAVEARHVSWITDDFFDMLAQNKIAFVIADSGGKYPYCEKVTADDVYLRFHGNTSLYASDYTIHELKQYAEKIINWLDDKKTVWVFFNNDYNGFAVKNALQLKEIIFSFIESRPKS